MPPPYVAIVNRKGAETYPTRSPSQLNERAVTVIAPQQAPDPPRRGDTPARIARFPRYVMVAKRQWRMAMADHQAGVMGKTAFNLFLSSPQGKQLAWDNRVNIASQRPVAYGSQFEVSPQAGYEAHLQTLMGV